MCRTWRSVTLRPLTQETGELETPSLSSVTELLFEILFEAMCRRHFLPYSRTVSGARTPSSCNLKPKSKSAPVHSRPIRLKSLC